MKAIKLFFITLTLSTANLLALPLAPVDENHPGSLNYAYESEYQEIEIQGRRVDLYLPVSTDTNEKFPVVVYGHGQALNHTHYEGTFFHLAQKGIAVIFPQYDRGFFDRNWRRMGSDYNAITQEVLEKYSTTLNASQVVYSGHSKGAYVALVAAGAPNFVGTAKSLVLFVPAGFDEEYLSQMSDLPMNLIWGTGDNIVDREQVFEIYNKSPLPYKQFIDISPYDDTEPAHFYVLTKRSLFGGQDGFSPFHYYGVFQWLIGAVNDVREGGQLLNPYLYGDQATNTGVQGLEHRLERSW